MLSHHKLRTIQYKIGCTIREAAESPPKISEQTREFGGAEEDRTPDLRVANAKIRVFENNRLSIKSLINNNFMVNSRKLL